MMDPNVIELNTMNIFIGMWIVVTIVSLFGNMVMAATIKKLMRDLETERYRKAR